MPSVSTRKSFQSLISFKYIFIFYLSIIWALFVSKDPIHTSRSITAAPAALLLWGFLCLVCCWVGSSVRNGDFTSRYPWLTGVRIGDSCQDDLLVGIPEAGRGDPRLQKIIGFFVPLGKNMTNIQAENVAQKILWMHHVCSHFLALRLLCRIWFCFSTWIGCLVLLQRCFAKEHLAYPPIL